MPPSRSIQYMPTTHNRIDDHFDLHRHKPLHARAPESHRLDRVSRARSVLKNHRIDKIPAKETAIPVDTQIAAHPLKIINPLAHHQSVASLTGHGSPPCGWETCGYPAYDPSGCVAADL